MERLLIVVDEALGGADPIPTEVRRLLGQFDEIRVVVPALNSRLRSWASDNSDAVTDAEARLRRVLGQLEAAGLTARGEVGDEDPAQALEDALHAYPADRVVAVHHARGFERYREAGLLGRIRARFAGPVDSLQLDRAGRVVAHT